MYNWMAHCMQRGNYESLQCVIPVTAEKIDKNRVHIFINIAFFHNLFYTYVCPACKLKIVNKYYL